MSVHVVISAVKKSKEGMGIGTSGGGEVRSCTVKVAREVLRWRRHLSQNCTEMRWQACVSIWVTAFQSSGTVRLTAQGMSVPQMITFTEWQGGQSCWSGVEGNINKISQGSDVGCERRDIKGQGWLQGVFLYQLEGESCHLLRKGRLREDSWVGVHQELFVGLI